MLVLQPPVVSPSSPLAGLGAIVMKEESPTETVRERLTRLGWVLPEPPAAVAIYIPAKVVGEWCWTSGQLPFAYGQLVATGKAGRDVSLDQARKAARQAALNALAAAARAAGDLERIQGVLKLVGFVQSAEDFHDQPQIINAASELFVDLFGEDGRHVRSAVGINALPLNAVVELECVFQIRIGPI